MFLNDVCYYMYAKVIGSWRTEQNAVITENIEFHSTL